MRQSSLCVFVTGMNLALATACAQVAAAPPAPIHAGPVYTASGETKNDTKSSTTRPYPQFPDLQIQVELPPGTSPAQVTPEAFRLAVDGRHAVGASRVQTLASTGYGVSASLSLDVSGSMRGAPLNAVRAGLTRFVNDAGPHDKVAIQTIADDSRWDVNWNDPRDKVRTALDQLATRGQLTRLWDGLLLAIRHLPPDPRARRLIVISDGHDEGSVHNEEQVIAAAKAGSVPLDAIGVTQSDPKYLQALQRLATETGGQFRAAKDTNELQEMVGSGITRLKSTPVVSFRVARGLGDGAAHHLDMTWTHAGNDSVAGAVAVLPLTPAISRQAWLWAGVSGFVVIALLFVIILASRRPGRATTIPTPAPIPPQAAPQPLASAPPSRPRTDVPPVGPPFSARTPPLPTLGPPAEQAKTAIGARYPQPQHGRPAAWLLCERGFAPGQRFAVGDAEGQVEFWIGALEGNHLQITDDPTVSRNHACLVFDHDVLGIHDHHSTNGTRVNGEVLQNDRLLLHPGDRIQIGQTVFVLQIAGEPQQPA